MNSSTLAISSDVAELKDMVNALLLDKKNQSPTPTPTSTPAPFKAVEPNCVNQAPIYQAPIPQTQRVSQTDFERYVKANDAILRNMQSQGQSTQNQCQNIQNQYQNLQIQMATLKDMMSKFVSFNTASSSGSGTLLVTKDQVQTPSSQNTAPVQPSVIQSESQAPVSEPVVAPVSAPMPDLKPFIPYLSRRDNEKCRDQANEQIKKFYEIFKDMSFEISFTDALILMPKFALTLKALIGDKEKLNEMARTPMNEHYLGASINLMPFSVWEALSLLKLTPTCMTLELADRSVSKPIGIAKDVSFKVGVFPFPTSRALIDVHKGELTLRIKNEAITYNLDQTMSEPLPPLPNHEQYLPSYKKELKVCEAKTVKSSVDEPPEVELKDVPPHLEYAFLEGNNKLPVIIAKELGDEEKSALIKVLKSHKRAIAWKLSDIQGINLEFCTHKILMEEDYKPVVQHQRWVNPKIHNVIKKEVEKLLDDGLIYPISDSPWVSLVHCVPKKGGFTMVENEENELIPTRLVTRWRVCIDYRK
nr:reverse transcriptase domain-containing protein [Tanacetum cinerariifolium]